MEMGWSDEIRNQKCRGVPSDCKHGLGRGKWMAFGVIVRVSSREPKV